MRVIPAKSEIQKNTGFRIKPGMTDYITPIEQKIGPRPTVGGDSGGGERSRTSTPILPFPPATRQAGIIRGKEMR